MTTMTTEYKYKIEMSPRYRKELRKMIKRGKNEDDIIHVVNMLARDEPLPPKNKDHPLHGKWEGMRECHIEPDWLLIYKKYKDTLILLLSRTGTHSDLLDM